MKFAAAGVGALLVAGVVTGGVVMQQDSTPTAAVAAEQSALPLTPPAQVCGNAAILDGPATPPPGAIVVPAGDNSAWTAPWASPTFSTPGATYWFEPGLHRIGGDQYAQIKPGANSTFIGAPGAILGGQNVNRFAFTKLPSASSANVTIKHLTIRYFDAPQQQGVVNGHSEPGWTITNNTLIDNNGAAMMGGDNQIVRDNCLTSNGQYGINGCCGYDADATNSGMVITGNEISNNSLDGEPFEGCGCTGGMKFWENQDLVFTGNWVHDNLGPGVWADGNNAGMLIADNLIEDNTHEAIFFEQSWNAVIKNNVLRGNTLEKGKEFADRNDNFPIGTIYISEAGYDSRLPAPPGATDLRVEGNLLQNNWGGIVLWENSARFCNSPYNTSTGLCTLVNPSVVNLDTCDAETFGADGSQRPEPYYRDCRWNTNDVTVTGNEFVLDPAAVPGYSAAHAGMSGVFSNVYNLPAWSPYKDWRIPVQVTFGNNNRWSSNTYQGPWHFSAVTQNCRLSWAEWTGADSQVEQCDMRGRSIAQDQGSTFNGSTPPPSSTTTAPPSTTTSNTVVPPPTTTTDSPVPTTAPTTTAAPVPAVKLVCPVVDDPVAGQKTTCTFRK